MNLKSLLAGLAACAILAGPAVAGQTPSVPGAQAYIISPKDGDVVKGPVKIVFGLKGMGLAPALVEWPKTGHHHVIVDVARKVHQVGRRENAHAVLSFINNGQRQDAVRDQQFQGVTDCVAGR